MNRWLALALVLVAAGGFALRAPQLNLRPMHNDEAVNAIKLNGLWEQASYRYDPNEYHGPFLYYATLPALWLSGAKNLAQVSESTLRMVPVVFGVAVILLLWLMADALGRSATVLAGVFAAISPAMVFYSRYFIHEMLLVCFMLLLLAAGWRYSQKRQAIWAIVAGAALGFMYATKETFLIPLAAMVGAAVLTPLWAAWWEQRKKNHLQGERPTAPGTAPAAAQPETQAPRLSPRHAVQESLRPFWNAKHALAAGGAALFVSLLFFTSFFSNWQGPLDSVRSYLPWLHRAGGASPHIHPWYFYFERLLWFHHTRGPVWSEALIFILALVGFVAALRGRKLHRIHVGWARFLAFFTALQTLAYCVISYKTPWCLLGFWLGMILLAGVGAVVLLRWHTYRWAQATVSGVLVVAMGHLTWQSWQTSFVLPADRGNPYVYAQTSPDILELVEKVQRLGRVHPQGDQMLIKVMVPEDDYWPLPWYLRQFSRIGWWSTLPADPLAPVMIVGARLESALAEQSEDTHLMTGIFSLRPRAFLELYVETNLWDRYMEARQAASAKSAGSD